MTLLKHILTVIILTFCLVCSAFALNIIKNDASFKVFLYMEKLTFEDNEPVLLHINIKNKTESNKSFKIYDSDYTSFKPVVFDMNGQEATTLVTYRLQNKTPEDVIKGIFPRVIELSQNETFAYIVDLKKIYQIESEKEYRVKAVFSPDIYYQDSILSENQLNFQIIKSATDIKNSGISRLNRFTSPMRSLSAGEVVLLFLKAEKDRDWNNYFKFIDIEKYINAYPDYVRIYNLAVKKNDVEQKEKIILKFVDFLKEERSDYILAYKVQNELRTSESNIYVDALVKRFTPRSPFTYKYRYLLEKHENLWLITDVEVTVSKGQKI